jgi:AcrR family transcriptional regulator
MNKRSGEETRQRIIVAARQVFTDYGYDAASMRLISQAADISIGGIYLYFRNKAELYQTILSEWLDGLQERTRESLAKAKGPQEEISVFITEALDHARRNRETLLLQSGESCELGRDQKREFFQERRRVLAGIVRSGIDQGLFRESDPDETARIMFNLIRGFIVSLIMEEEALFSTEACVDLLLNGLVRRSHR